MVPAMRNDFRQQRASFPAAQADAGAVSSVMTNVFWWMSVGLGLTGLIAFGVANTPAAIEVIFGNRIVFWGLLLGELALVFTLSAAITRLSPLVATAMFLAYAAMNGLTLAVIFLIYTQGSIASTFFVTGGTFGAMAAFGTLTKRDLSGWGSFLFMGLIGVIIASVVNIFLASPMLYWAVTYAGVLVFVGLTAYDTQRIRQMAASGALPANKLAIYGALRLYLDFINLFLMLLRIFGRRR